MKFFKNKKKIFIAAISVVAIACIGTGTTLAYLSAHAGETLNVFKVSKDITATLSEPNWNADEGLKLVPGKTVRKDPMITNTSENDMEEYVAIRVTFQYSDKQTTLSQGDYIKLMSCVSVNWNVGTGNEEWTLVDGANTPEQIYVYNKSLSVGEISNPVMNSVYINTVNEGLTQAQLRWLQAIKYENGNIVADDTGLGGINIKVEGGVVEKSIADTPSEAAEVLKSLFS